MSSEILLQGEGITKSFTSPLTPLSRLKSAVLNSDLKGELFHVLKSIDITINRGETVGIMGRNGAGKSTLLGILGNVLPASSGKITRTGKMSVLLELGAGFNPNMSGIENAKIYCRMMGLADHETEERVNLIEEFAELGKYFYLPIRTYSSGMYSRLGFASAVHVNSDIIIIDETLSVGDASFKMKCYDKINEMKESGLTFLLVSHSQNIIANFCSRAILLEEGYKVFDGEPIEAIGLYKEIRSVIESRNIKKKLLDKNAKKNRVEHDLNNNLLVVTDIIHDDVYDGEIEKCILAIKIKANIAIMYPGFAIGIRNSSGIAIASMSTLEMDEIIPPMEKGDEKEFKIEFRNLLNPGPYFISYNTFEMVGEVQNYLSNENNALRFDVVCKKQGHGIVRLDMNIQILN